MNSQEFERKLSAILSADVVEYSRLMSEDEDTTIRDLTSNREMMATLIKQYRGRVVDSPGDNLLAEFSSVTQAVNCAVEIQRELAERNADLPEERRMAYRIGVNVGDIAQEGERIYGDGVNIAARLESLAEPGGICVSGLVYSHIKNKLKLEYEYLGKQTVKNISEPIPVYRIVSLQKSSIQIDVNRDQMNQLSGKPSIAVLPFVNMSNDPEQEYFSDGMAEEVIGALSKLEGLKVISRTSVFYFKGKDVKLRQVGEELKVDHVLEGSVRKAGNKLRISAQLIRVDDDTHLWSETYDRELSDVFAIQDEISQAVVQNLKVKLLGMKTEPLVKDHTKNTEAYELFLKGRFFYSKGLSKIKNAIDSYEKAIEVDPEFAPAYSNLAIMYFRYALFFSQPSKEIYPKVRTLVQKALEIDEKDSDAYSSMGHIKTFFEYDWQGAERDHKRAIELNPGNSRANYYYAMYLIGVGRVYEAVEKMKYVLELDPLSVYFHSILCAFFYFARQFDKAITQSKKTLELAHNEPLALGILALCHAAKGMYDEGIMMLQEIRDIPLIKSFFGYLYGKAGKNEEAQKILDDFLKRVKQGYFSPYMIASVYTGLGDKDKAFGWLKKGVEERDTNNIFIKVEPKFDDLHSDPRWTKLMEKMGLAD